MEQNKSNIVDNYKKEIPKYDDFRKKVEILINELILNNDLKYHKIESRTKGINSLEKKIQKKEAKYDNLDDITDLVGIRIITYFEDEVDKIATIIEKEFILDKEHSIDKRKLETDRFGYKSLHYVVSLNKERKSLTEYRRFRNLKFEIQLRSILQHAWAEIEHDLGYKNELGIPDSLKRNFYRVAALLETADIEFLNIKNKLNLYEKEVINKIKYKPDDVEINFLSLNSYVANSDIVKQIDEDIANKTRTKIDYHFISMNYHLKLLKYLNIKTIKELDNLLLKYKNIIPNYTKIFLNKDLGSGAFSIGISIFYLGYIIIAEKNDINVAIEYAKKVIYSDNTKEGIVNTLAKDIIDSYNEMMKNVL
jgi:putative GTP pyrophosphokinase